MKPLAILAALLLCSCSDRPDNVHALVGVLDTMQATDKMMIQGQSVTEQRISALMEFNTALLARVQRLEAAQGHEPTGAATWIKTVTVPGVLTPEVGK